MASQKVWFETEDSVFIGSLYAVKDRADLDKAIKKWAGVVHTYFHGTGAGWGLAKFKSKSERDTLLRTPALHFINGRPVDVKAYNKPDRASAVKQAASPAPPSSPKKVPVQNNSHSVKPAVARQPQLSVNLVVKTNLEIIPTILMSENLGSIVCNVRMILMALKPLLQPRPIAPPQAQQQSFATAAAASAPSGPTSSTAVVIEYVTPDFGLLRTTDGVNGFFHADTAFLCTVHGRGANSCSAMCQKKFIQARDVTTLSETLLPLGSTVSFQYRSIPDTRRYGCDIQFQVTLLWPHNVEKPGSYVMHPDSVLNEQSSRFFPLYLMTQLRLRSRPAPPELEATPASFTCLVSADEAVVSTREYGSFVVKWRHLQFCHKEVDRRSPMSHFVNPEMVLTALLRSCPDDPEIKLLVGLKRTRRVQVDNDDVGSGGNLDQDLEKLVIVTNFLQEEFQFLQKESLPLPTLAMKLLAARNEAEVAHLIRAFEMEAKVNIDTVSRLQIVSKTCDVIEQLRRLNEPENPSPTFDPLNSPIGPPLGHAHGPIGSKINHADQIPVSEERGESTRQMVKIRRSGEIFEFATSSSGDLPIASVSAVFHAVNALTYAEAGVIRVCGRTNAVFEKPVDGWGNRVYVAV